MYYCIIIISVNFVHLNNRYLVTLNMLKIIFNYFKPQLQQNSILYFSLKLIFGDTENKHEFY